MKIVLCVEKQNLRKAPQELLIASQDLHEIDAVGAVLA
jgi:hypothetical protein